MQKPCFLKRLIAATSVCLVLASAAVSEAAVVASGRAVRDFSRVSFEWPEATSLQSRMDGKTLLITFDKPIAQPDFSRLLARLPKVVRSATVRGDGRTVALVLDQPYRVRNFVSGRTNGVDLLGGNAPVAKGTTKEKQTNEKNNKQKAQRDKIAKDKATREKTAKENLRKEKAQKEKAQKEKLAKEKAARERRAQEGAAKEKIAKEKIANEQAAKVALAQAARVTESAQAAVPPVSTTAPAPSPQVVESPAVPTGSQPAPAPENAAPAPAQQTIRTEAKHPNAVALNAKLATSGNQITVEFPWLQRTASAAFRRGDTVWVVFDQPASIRFDRAADMAAMLPEVTSRTVDAATVVRLQAPSMAGLRMQTMPGGNGWILSLTPQLQSPDKPLPVQVKAASASKPATLLVPALEAGPSVTLPDPVIGDSLIVVPTYTSSQGVDPGRSFVGLEVLPSAQGVVVAPSLAGVVLQPQRNGLRIYAEKGLQLSADLPTPRADETSTEATGGSLFSRQEMAPPTGQSVAQLVSALVPLTAQKGAVANEARRRMALAYLSEGLAAEAIGMIEAIRGDDLDYYIREKLSAYAGLANFLMYRLPEASRDFAAPELMENDEAEYWRVALAELNGRSDVLFDYAPFNARYLKQYPEFLRQRLAVIAADRLVARARFNEAIAVMEGLRAATLDKDPNTAHAMDYLMGEVFARTGYPEKAEERWKKLIADVADRYWRARAQYALTNLRLAQEKMTDEDAINQLEVVRLLWRDDPIELQTLNQLADLYLKTKHYRDALRTLREITQAYEGTDDAFAAAQKMAETFVYLFNQDGAKSMKPLDALALYYEFKDLTPVEAAGDQMIRNLADRLAEVDLLDRAAALLEHQVRHRLQGEERSRVGAQLALLYLFNRQPQRALDVLELTGYGANTEALQNKRALLTARALADLKEGDRAIALLEDDSSTDAQLLKLDVLWDQGAWDKVVGLGEELLSQRTDPAAMLTDSEVGTLLKLAVAYTFQKDAAQLRYLRDYFSPLMAQGAQKDLFNFLTNDTPVAPETVAQLAQNINQMQSFLSRWRTQVREGGLSNAVR